MNQRLKKRVMCCLTAFGVVAGTMSAVVPVMADDEIPYGAKLEYEKRHAYQEYIIEHANDPEPAPAEDIITPENAKKRGFEHVSNITLNYGDTYSVFGTGAHYESTDPNVASVDSNGVITAHNDGHCTVFTTLQDGSHYRITFVEVKGYKEKKDNNNVVYNTVYTPVYTPFYAPFYAPLYAPVYAAPVYAAPAPAGNSWLGVATNMVVAAPQKGTVNLSSPAPLFFDAGFANILKLRPDVTVNVTFGYAGHTFLLTIPRGYNLASKLGPTGTVDFVTLSNVVDGKIRCTLLY